MKRLFCLFYILCLAGKAQTPSLTVSSTSGSYSLTCANPFLYLTAYCTSANGTISIAWLSVAFASNGNTATISSPGIYTVIANSGTATATQTFAVYVNTTTPVSSLSSTFQVLTSTMTPAPVTVTAISPTINIHHEFYAPTGGTTVATSTTSVYQPGSIGTYTHCIFNDENGCSSCQPFSIQYGSPGTVSIRELTGNKNSMFIYPNPVRDRLKVSASENNEEALFCIYNSAGVLVEENILLDSENSISTENLSNGLYVLKQNGEGPHVLYRRFVVQK